MGKPFDWRDFFFSFEGRISRKAFSCGFLALMAMLIAIVSIAGYLPEMAGDFICGVAYTATIYPLAALMAKRLRDRGKGPGYVLLFLGVPVACSIFNLYEPASSNPVALLFSILYVPVILWALIELSLLSSVFNTAEYAGRPLKAS